MPYIFIVKSIKKVYMNNVYGLSMGKSYPEEQLRRLRKKRRMNILKLAILFTFAMLGEIFILNHFSGVLKIGFNIPFLAVLLLFLLALIFFALMLHYFKPSKDERKFSRGVEGEKLFKKYLDKLRGYKFYSLPLPHGGDIDALLISNKGIFAFEVKNYSGIIECEEDEWKRIKIGKGGGKYEGHVGKPSEEAKRHAFDLQNYLNTKGFAVMVYPVVVITHSESILRCERCSVRVIKPQELRILLNKKNELTDKECKRIYKEISKLI